MCERTHNTAVTYSIMTEILVVLVLVSHIRSYYIILLLCLPEVQA